MFKETDAQYKVLTALLEDMNDENLWNAVVAFQDVQFYTVSGLPFKYELKVGRDGSYNKELIVNRREGSKSIVWSSVILAFRKALDMTGAEVPKPKALGDIRGISYIYPVFYRFGIIEVPDKYKRAMDEFRSFL